MSKPIIDNATVSIDFPDKFYHGSFSQSSSFDVSLDDEGINIVLDRREGERRHVAFHLHPHLFALMLEALADEISAGNQLPEINSDQLKEAADRLAESLR